ncbi:MAG: nicotinate (nicotinamide) nucleotide adenylyltransferase [Spirochaetaceae bacterium]|nr:MAG: nicotinate (nicotinamide) nucleotide adenylyltransferase [Spirochaetaceae bacterium]
MGVAVFGGSFDPVHIGHLHVADSALLIPWVDHVYFVPAGMPPHKKLSGGADGQQRLAMLSQSVADRPGLSVLDWELGESGPSYTCPTVERVRKELSGDARVGLIIGTDLLPGFTTWKDWSDLLTLVTLLLTRHPDGDDPRAVLDSKQLQAYPSQLRSAIERAEVIDHIPLSISSSSVRNRIARGSRYRDLLPESANRIIHDQGLYSFQ